MGSGRRPRAPLALLLLLAGGPAAAAAAAAEGAAALRRGRAAEDPEWVGRVAALGRRLSGAEAQAEEGRGLKSSRTTEDPNEWDPDDDGDNYDEEDDIKAGKWDGMRSPVSIGGVTTGIIMALGGLLVIGFCALAGYIRWFGKRGMRKLIEEDESEPMKDWFEAHTKSDSNTLWHRQNAAAGAEQPKRPPPTDPITYGASAAAAAPPARF